VIARLGRRGGRTVIWHRSAPWCGGQRQAAEDAPQAPGGERCFFLQPWARASHGICWQFRGAALRRVAGPAPPHPLPPVMAPHPRTAPDLQVRSTPGMPAAPALQEPSSPWWCETPSARPLHASRPAGKCLAAHNGS